MRTIEDTIRGLDHELRQLSLDIHGERSQTAPTGRTDTKSNETCDLHFLGHPELNFEERLVCNLKFPRLTRPGQSIGQLTALLR
jgi:hypothetical protein